MAFLPCRPALSRRHVALVPVRQGLRLARGQAEAPRDGPGPVQKLQFPGVDRDHSAIRSGDRLAGQRGRHNNIRRHGLKVPHLERAFEFDQVHPEVVGGFVGLELAVDLGFLLVVGDVDGGRDGQLAVAALGRVSQQILAQRSPRLTARQGPVVQAVSVPLCSTSECSIGSGGDQR